MRRFYTNIVAPKFDFLNKHYYTWGVTTTISDKYGHTASSTACNISVYQLWLQFFSDAATDKIMKVCVGENIMYSAVASSDCKDFNWTLGERYWPLINSGGTRKSGADIRVDIATLSQGLSNMDFGNTHGRLRISCTDSTGTLYGFYSTQITNGYKAKVYIATS